MSMRSIAGVLLILSGAYLFLHHGATISTGGLFAYFWPSLFVIPLGIFFHWMYFYLTGRRGAGLLIPGGVLIVVGAVCQLAALFHSWGYMWPGFILAPAVGLFEFYWFGVRNKWLWIPINILTALSLLFFAVFSIGSIYNHLVYGRSYLTIAFILAGAALLLGNRKRKERYYP